MPLDTTLADITVRLRQNEFPNEQAISQGIVLRMLQELGWNTWDTSVVWPEYKTGGGRADFALCSPPSKPAIFIEVKHVGKAEGAVRQALQYAFECGVPFVVLTDGRTWSFYLPAEQGDYEDRRVYKIDLYERSSSEAAEAFRRYLSRSTVESGKSLEDARTEYRNLNRRSQARAAIPVAWQELVDKRDAGLIEILVDTVESKVGFQPDPSDVAGFLGNLQASAPSRVRLGDAQTRARSSGLAPSGPASLGASTSPRPPASTGKAPLPAPNPPVSPGPQRLSVRGKEHDFRNAKDAMVIVLRELARTDPSLLERCAGHADGQGRKRRYIARTPEDLYPDRPDLQDRYEKLPGGWLVMTNMSNEYKRKVVELAVKLAGLQVGTDVVVPF